MLRILKQYYPIRNALFVVGEALVIYLSVLLACLIILGPETFAFHLGVVLKTLLITTVCQVCLYYNDLYDLKITDSFLELGIRLFQALGFSAILLAIAYFAFPDLIVEEGVFVVSICIIIVFVVSWRFGYQLILNRGFFNQRIIILGSGPLAQNIAREINWTKDCGYAVAAVVSEHSREGKPANMGSELISLDVGYGGLAKLALEMKARKIVVALEEKRGAFPTRELLEIRMEGIEVLDGATFYEMLTGKVLVEDILPGWLIYSEGFTRSSTRRFLKRSVDLIVSSALLVAGLPFILLTGLAIKIGSRGSVFFKQERIGEKQRPYWMYKFRSMIPEAEKKSGPVWAKDDDDRITRVGRFIRMWRVDEVPQLWNVLKGEMSFVGPRPEREHFVNQLNSRIPFYGQRFSVKPGITGWAQISYGYGASVEDAIEKLNYDLFYIKNMSTFMDIVIIVRTVKTVIFSRGAR